MPLLQLLAVVAGVALALRWAPGPSAEREVGAAPETRTVEVAAAPLAPAPALRVGSAPPEPAGLAKAVRAHTFPGMVYLPRGWHAPDGAFDVVIHFHGAPHVVEAELDRAGVRAALLTVNLGVGSAVYDAAYGDAMALDRALAAVRKVAARSDRGARTVRRVALSSWSAGYGAVSRVLSYPGARSRVDAVLLADGLHTPFLGREHVHPGRLASFVALAAEAARGEKLFALTHSEIPTYRYASTTETADHLLDQLGLPRFDDAAAVRGAMRATSSAGAGDFHVRAFEGTDEEAHCQHLRNVGETLLPMLAQRWRRPGG